SQPCIAVRPCPRPGLSPEHCGGHGRALRARPATPGGTGGTGRRPAGVRLQCPHHGRPVMPVISRKAYTEMFGPTVLNGRGDRVRLADTTLLAEVERDFTTFGEEVKF